MNERMARSVLSMMVFTRSFCIDKIQIVKFSSCMAIGGVWPGTKDRRKRLQYGN